MLMANLLQPITRSIWEPLLAVSMPWQLLVVTLALLFFTPLFLLRILPWLLTNLLKIVLAIAEATARLLLWCLGWIAQTNAGRDRLPAIIYLVDDILAVIPLSIREAKNSLKKLSAISYTKQWIFRKKTWYALPLLVIPMWFMRPWLGGITPVANLIDGTATFWCSLEHWAMTGQWTPSSLTCTYPTHASSWNHTLKATEYRYKREIIEFTRAIAANPKNIDAYHSRANRYLELGNTESAFKDFTKTIRINSKYAPGYTGRGNVYLKLNDVDSAFREFTTSVQRDPKYAPGYVGRGDVYQHKKDKEVALREYSKAIKLDPKYARAYFNRGNLYCDRFGNQEAATQDFKLAAKLFQEQEHQNRYSEVISSIEKLDYTYEVRSGDSLSKIAQNYNISLDSLISINQNTYPSIATDINSIEVGWKLIIPICK